MALTGFFVVPRGIDATAFQDRPFRLDLRDFTAISPRDLQQLYVKSVDTVSIEGQSGVPFQIFYG